MQEKQATVSINTPRGVTLKTNATHTYMNGVKQNANGGEISHNAQKTLVQENNQILASNKGEIINEVEAGGSLIQRGNEFRADDKGKIVNRIKSKPSKVIGIVVAIGVLADLASILIEGEHFSSLF